MKAKKIIGYILVLLELALVIFFIAILKFALSDAGKKALKNTGADDAALVFSFLIGLVVFLGFITYRFLIRSPASADPDNLRIANIPIASVGSRFAASLIDGLLVLPLVVAGYFIPADNPMIILIILILNHLLFLYDFLFDWLTGQTLGKKLIGIRVMTLSGQNLSMSHATLRSIIFVMPNIASLAILILNSHEIRSTGLLNLAYAEFFEKMAKNFPAYDLSGHILLGVFMIDIVVLLLSRQTRALHDFMSKTAVVKI